MKREAHFLAQFFGVLLLIFVVVSVLDIGGLDVRFADLIALVALERVMRLEYRSRDQ